MRYFATIVAAGVILLLSCRAECDSRSARITKARELTVNEARELLTIELRGEGLSGFDLDYSKHSFDPRFYLFTALGGEKPGDNIVNGSYLVDKKTGDVWDGIMCQEYKSYKLDMAKAAIRKKIGLSRNGYVRVKVKGPYC